MTVPATGFMNGFVGAQNANFSSVGNASSTTGLQTNGQLWVGTTALNAAGTHINVGAITSSDGSISVGYNSPNINLTTSGGTVGGLVLIASKTATAQASVTFTSGFNYNNYLLTFNDFVPANNSDNLNIQISIDGGATYIAANYAVNTLFMTTTWAGGSAFTTAFTPIFNVDNNLSSAGSVFFYDFSTATAGTNIQAISQSNGPNSGGKLMYQMSGWQTTAAGHVVNALKIFCNSGGNITSGTFNLYGISTINGPSTTFPSGVLIGNGTSTITGNPVTQFDVLVGGATNAVTSITPSTAGFVLTSNGAGSNPTFQAAGSATNFTATNFQATLLAAPLNNCTGDGTVVFPIYDTVKFDNGSNYNNATGLYTLPATGQYMFYASYVLTSIGAAHNAASLDITDFTNSTVYPLGIINPANMAAGAALNTGILTYTTTLLVRATAGDTIGVQFRIDGGTKTINLQNNALSYFGGYRLS